MEWRGTEKLEEKSGSAPAGKPFQTEFKPTLTNIVHVLEYFVNVLILSGFNLHTIRQRKWFQIVWQMMMMIDGSNDDKEIVNDDNGGGQVV